MRAFSPGFAGSQRRLRRSRRPGRLRGAAIPGFVAANGALAGLHVVRFTQGWSVPEDVAEGVRCAREVVEQGGEDDPTFVAAHALAYMGREYGTGLAAAGRALRLAPNAAGILLICGTIRAYTGDADAAVALIERATRLSPVDPGMLYANRRWPSPTSSPGGTAKR